MSDAIDATLDYIRADDLSSEVFAQRVGVAPARIEEFIAHLCLPSHSYEVETRVVVRSLFGERGNEARGIRYFSPSHVERERAIEEKSRQMPLASIAK